MDGSLLLASNAQDALCQPIPCDACALRQQCAVKQTACKAFVLFIHGGRNAWRKVDSRIPTASLYRLAMQTDLEPDEVLAAVREQLQLDRQKPNRARGNKRAARDAIDARMLDPDQWLPYAPGDGDACAP